MNMKSPQFLDEGSTRYVGWSLLFTAFRGVYTLDQRVYKAHWFC